MFFNKIKCPACGVKNSKEHMTCNECGNPLTLERIKSHVAKVVTEEEESLETVIDAESTTLCAFCKWGLECSQKGISGREICIQFAQLPTVKIVEHDSSMEATMVKVCPECSSENCHDCEANPLLEDYTIGHCLDCGTYWCLECGYLFESVKEGMECPHWEICIECSDERGYLEKSEFEETICSTCEQYDKGCQLEDSLQCDEQSKLLCPYESTVSVCPKIEKLLWTVFEEKVSIIDSQNIESEYISYIPGKCVHCGSSDVSEALKKTIKGAVTNGYLWDINCSTCGAKWVALEKPDFQ